MAIALHVRIFSKLTSRGSSLDTCTNNLEDRFWNFVCNYRTGCCSPIYKGSDLLLGTVAGLTLLSGMKWTILENVPCKMQEKQSLSYPKYSIKGISGTTTFLMSKSQCSC